MHVSIPWQRWQRFRTITKLPSTKFKPQPASTNFWRKTRTDCIKTFPLVNLKIKRISRKWCKSKIRHRQKKNLIFKKENIVREKGRDLTQSYDKSPYTNRNVKRAKRQLKQRHKKVRLKMMSKARAVLQVSPAQTFPFCFLHNFSLPLPSPS